jgi:hypothetical protein
MGRTFGADDQPLCEICERPMRLTRRSPTVGNEDHEDQVFTCSSCDHNQVREADVEGDVMR